LIRKFSDQQVNFFKTNHFLMVRTSAIHKLNQPWWKATRHIKLIRILLSWSLQTPQSF